jgi:hypothetical protein
MRSSPEHSNSDWFSFITSSALLACTSIHRNGAIVALVTNLSFVATTLYFDYNLFIR